MRRALAAKWQHCPKRASRSEEETTTRHRGLLVLLYLAALDATCTIEMILVSTVLSSYYCPLLLIITVITICTCGLDNDIHCGNARALFLLLIC